MEKKQSFVTVVTDGGAPEQWPAEMVIARKYDEIRANQLSNAMRASAEFQAQVMVLQVQLEAANATIAALQEANAQLVGKTKKAPKTAEAVAEKVAVDIAAEAKQKVADAAAAAKLNGGKQ